jgi:hypothetical protein
VFAGTIDTSFLEGSWPKQLVRELEVGRYPVRWRQRASASDGIFAGIRFLAPLPRQVMWEQSTDYSDIGQITPGVTAVRYLEQSEHRQVIQIDAKVLWKTLQMTFEVEQEPPKAIRFRLTNEALGDYRGLCTFEETPTSTGPGTTAELITWLKPSRPVPMGALLLLERMVLLRAVREFLQECERQAKAPRAN